MGDQRQICFLFPIAQNSRAERPIQVSRHLAMRQPHWVCCSSELYGISGMFPGIQEKLRYCTKSPGPKRDMGFRTVTAMRVPREKATWVNCTQEEHVSTSMPTFWHYIILPDLKDSPKTNEGDPELTWVCFLPFIPMKDQVQFKQKNKLHQLNWV